MAQLPHRPAAPALPIATNQAPQDNRDNAQSSRRQAALQQLAARSRSRSNSSSRALSKQASRTDLGQPPGAVSEQPLALDHTLLNHALAHDAAAARLAGDYLAAVHSAASIHSAAASSASSWPRQSDLPIEAQSERQQQWAGAKGNGQGLMGSNWEQVVRQGVELAQGPTTEQFLQVVDLYPEHSLGQVIASLLPTCLFSCS